jgi:hypothetical protein
MVTKAAVRPGKPPQLVCAMIFRFQESSETCRVQDLEVQMNFKNGIRGELLFSVATLILALLSSACGGSSSQSGTPGTQSRSISVVLSPLSSSVVPAGTTTVSATADRRTISQSRHFAAEPLPRNERVSSRGASPLLVSPLLPGT